MDHRTVILVSSLGTKGWGNGSLISSRKIESRQIENLKSSLGIDRDEIENLISSLRIKGRGNVTLT